MRKKLLAITALVMSIFMAKAENQQFYFTKYQVEQGLSHNSVWCVTQDSYGFMWFGTNDGLNRFDGNNFKVYKNNLGDSLSLGNNLVKAICEDHQKKIWVGTNKGIYIFSHNNEKFTPFTTKTSFGVPISSEIKKIEITKNGNIWIGTLGQGLFIYNPEKDILIQDSRNSSFVWDICPDPYGRIYISGHQENIICYDQNGKYLVTYDFQYGKQERGKPQINALQFVNDKIWFSSGPNTLNWLDPKTGEAHDHKLTAGNTGMIRCIEKYTETELIVGSDDGLFIYNTITNLSFKIGGQTTLPLDSRGLSDQSIRAIFKDIEGGYWIASYLGGINYLAPQTRNFDYFPPILKNNRVMGKVVNTFCEDHNKNIWIGSHDCLRVFDNKTQSLTVVDIPGNSQDIRALLIDGDNLWIGTYGDGLKVMNLATRKIKEYRNHREVIHSLCSNDISSLFRDDKGTIYVGTSWGMCIYNREKDNFTTIKEISTMTGVSDITQDRNGNVWIATNDSGLFRFDTNGVWHFYIYDQDDNRSLISSNSVITIFEDSKDNIWLGTDGGGLIVFDKETDSFSNFDPENKLLPNKVIYSIEEDNDGNLWISTNAGLLRINPDKKDNLKIYTQENGLQSNQFSAGASLKASNDKYYFGGINGFNTFYPDKFTENTYIPPVYIVGMNFTDRKKSGLPIDIKPETSIYITKELTLPYNHNHFELAFSVLSYEDIRHNQYCYKLTGFSNEWIYTNNNTVSYANLTPGQYTFHVKGSNNDGQWNNEGAILKIIISPPWWQSTVAYIIYALLGIAAVYVISGYSRKKTDQRIQRELEQYNIETEKEVYRSKINFFVNLVHEIRTPLSLIKLPLDKLTESLRVNDSNLRYLDIVNKNIDYLLNIVNQLLDFQKTENKQRQLELRNEDLNDLIEDIYDQFSNYLKIRNIDFKLNIPEQGKVIPIDSNSIRKIIVNLMSNAIKYTDSKIEIELKYFDDHFTVSVCDDGPGIYENEKENIFKAFHQVDEDNPGTGIGLAFSKLLAEHHHGTLSVTDNELGGATFTLSIPIETVKTMTSVNTSAAGDIIVDTATTEQTEQNNDTGFKSCRILVVEDNPDLLNLISEMLGHTFDVQTAKNGQEALNIIDKKNIDIIVSDVMMPGIDGFELTKKIKSDINTSHIPVILLTAKATPEAKVEGMQYGADVYIEKPFSLKHLEYQIKNLLKLRLSFQKMALTMMPNIPAKETATPAFNKDMEFLKKLSKAIDEHISELDFSIDLLAESMFMSRSNFYRKIKSITGMAPNDYLKVIRLNKAAQLLREDDTRIIDVYERVGFNSSSYFAKCFKAQFGVLPKDYADSQKKKDNENLKLRNI